MRELCYGLVRVLDFDGQAKGPWNPNLAPDRLRTMLRYMMLLRAFDDRMFRAQRQGKPSFYMKSTVEEATSVASTMTIDRPATCFHSYRPHGLLNGAALPAIPVKTRYLSNQRHKTPR